MRVGLFALRLCGRAFRGIGILAPLLGLGAEQQRNGCTPGPLECRYVFLQLLKGRIVEGGQQVIADELRLGFARGFSRSVIPSSSAVICSGIGVVVISRLLKCESRSAGPFVRERLSYFRSTTPSKAFLRKLLVLLGAKPVNGVCGAA